LKTISKVARTSGRLDLFCGRIRIFPANFSNPKIAKERQALNYRIKTHKKSLHSEVDKPVCDNCPSKMENNLPVTLPYHDLKTAEESVPDRQSRQKTLNNASNFRGKQGCTHTKLRTWTNWRKTVQA